MTESAVPLKAGASLEFVIEFGEAIVVSGIPYIPFGIDSLVNDSDSIELEKKALFASLGESSQGVENAAATFVYTIESSASLLDTDGINATFSSAVPQIIFPDGARISDQYSNAITEDIILTPSFSLSDLKVDTIRPDITDITWSADGHTYNNESTINKFSVDEIITFNLSFSEVIYPNSFSESLADYSFTINLRNNERITPVAVSGTRHVVDGDVSILQFEFLIEEGYNASHGVSYSSLSGPAELFGDKAGNIIQQDLADFVGRSEEEINIFIDADLPDLLSIVELSEPAATSTIPKDAGAHYYVGANYKAADGERIVLQLSFNEEVRVSKIDASQDDAINLIAYFKDNSLPESSDNTYSFAYAGVYNELNSTLLFEYEVIPFGEPGVTNDDLDGIELDYLLLENASIRDDYGNDIPLDSSDDINLVYRAFVSTGDVDLNFLKNIFIETTPAEITGISFTGVDNGEDAAMASVLGEGGVIEVVLEFDQPVEFYYSLSGGNASKPSLALEIVEGASPNFTASNIVYAHHSSPSASDYLHTFTYTIQPEDANNTLSSIWLLRNSTLTDNGGHDDLMVVTGSRVYDQRNRDVQEDFSSDAIDDYIFDDGYARHPLIQLQTGTEPIIIFTRPEGYDGTLGVNDYIIYPLADTSSISFTLEYGASETNITQIQVLLDGEGDASDLPYLLLYGDLKDDSDADADGIADSSELWEARAYLSLEESEAESESDADGVFKNLVFVLAESEDPNNGFAAQYISAESLGIIYDSLVIGDSYLITTLQGNPIQTDLSAYTYNVDSSLTLSTARDRVFYDPNPRVVSVTELFVAATGAGDINYNLGERIEVLVNLSEDVEVSGTDNGTIRLYLLGEVVDSDLVDYYSDSSIALEYVRAGDTASELIFAAHIDKDIYAQEILLDKSSNRNAIETTGAATIKDLSPAGRELREFASSLGLTYINDGDDDSSVRPSIDSRAPRIDSIRMSRLPSGSQDNADSEVIEGNETVTFVSGDNLMFTLSFYSESEVGSAELISVFGSPYVDALAADGVTDASAIAGGPRLQLEIDPGPGYDSNSTTVRYADYSTHVGGASTIPQRNGYHTEHVFTYVITSADHDSTGIKIVGPLDASLGSMKNIPDTDISVVPVDQNEANYSLRGALLNLGMSADSEVEEYELSYVVVDNYPKLVGFHVDTPESTSHTTSDLRFTPDKNKIIQFYALINQEELSEDTLTNTIKLPFSIYDSLTDDIETFSAKYAGWRTTASSSDKLFIQDVEDHYPVDQENYSALLFTFDFASAPKARNVNANTIIIPENPFQDQGFNPKNTSGIAVDVSFDETNITDVVASGVDHLIVDFRPPEITAIELPAAGLYYFSTDPNSTMSDLNYKVTFSEPVYAANMPQHPYGTPMLYQTIGSGAESNATCVTSICVGGPSDGNSSVRSFSEVNTSVVEFSYSITASDSGYIDSFYVLGGPDTDANDGSINAITDAYGNALNDNGRSEFNGYDLPEFSTDGRVLSDSDSIALLVDNNDLFIKSVTLPEAGIYQSDDQIDLIVEFSREVKIKQSGSEFPTIEFLVGSQDGNYADGSTSASLSITDEPQSNILTFTYTVRDKLNRDDYDGIQLNPAFINWNAATVEDVLRSTEEVNLSALEMTDLTGFITSDVLSGVYIDVVAPALEVSELQLAANQDNVGDSFAANDYHYYLNSDLIFNLTFNEPVVIPSAAGEYQSFIQFAYEDSNGSKHERSVRFDPESASSTLAQRGLDWNYDLGYSADIYFVYEVSSIDVSSASDANGFIANGYLQLSDINTSGIVDRSGKQLLLDYQPAITPSTAVIDLDKTSIYSYNLFAVDENNQSYDLYSANIEAGAGGVLDDERYITSGQDLVIEFSFRHHPAEDPSQVVFDIGGNSGLYLEVDIDNSQGFDFIASLQEQSGDDKNYSDGTSTLRYLLDLSSYTDITPLSDLDGIGVAFPEADIANSVYQDQSGAVNLAFSDVFLSSLELVHVDTEGPSIESVYMQPSATGLTLYYGDKDELQITVQFSEAIDVASGTFNDIDLNFSLYDVDSSTVADRVANYLSQDGNRSYVFAYVVDVATDADFEQIYFDSVVLAHATEPDVTTIIGDTRADPNPLTNATFTYAISDAAVQYHAIDFADPRIASLIIPAGDAGSKSIQLGGGDTLALTMVTSREVAFGETSAPRLRLLADGTPITFHYSGDYNSSIFALSHTFTYTVGANIETGSAGLAIPADAFATDNGGGFDSAGNALDGDLNVSAGSTQFDTGGTSWSNNPTEYIFIDSRVPEFAEKYIPPQSLYLQYSDSSLNPPVEFNSSHIFALDTVNGSGFPSEFSAGFVSGDAPTAVDFTRPVYQSTIDGIDWYIWSATADGYYRISTTDPNTPWFFNTDQAAASIQDVFIPGEVNDFGILDDTNDDWYIVTNAGSSDFDPDGTYSSAEVSATLNQRYLRGETLYTYLVLSEPVQVGDDFSSEGDYGAYPDYSLSYTDAYAGATDTTADLALTFSHWLDTRPDADSAANKQVMVYTNTLNSSTVNKTATGVEPAQQLPDGAKLAIQDLFGNALAINEDNSISVYAETANNSIAGVQLSGYLVQLDSVSLYQLTSAYPDQINAINPELTYVIGDQLVLDLTFATELEERSYDATQDFFLTLMLNDASSKEHILGDSSPSAGTSGDTDQRYWYNSQSDTYDSTDRATYEADINTTSNFNNVLRYIFTISDRADGDDFNTLEEGVSDPNLSITGLSFSDDLVDEYGARVDVDGVLAALRAVSIPITIDSIRPQIYLSSNVASGGDYIELAEFTTYSRDDYFANRNALDPQFPNQISFTLSFTEPIVMPARSSSVDAGESDFGAGLRFQLSGISGDRNASSAYIPYSGADAAPEYTSTIFTYDVGTADDSGISLVDINATIYDLAGNVNYYSSAESNDTVTQSSFSSALYTGIDLDGRGPEADINAADDVQIKVVRPGDDPNIPLETSLAQAPYGVGTTLYFEVPYDQNIHTDNLTAAAEDIYLSLQTNTNSFVSAYIVDSQLDSYDSDSSSGSIANRRLSFTYTITTGDVSNSSGYILHSLNYDASELARYGILDAYGNGINEDNLTHDISAFSISTGEIDTVMPEITAVTINNPPTSSLYGADEVITFALTFNDAVSLVESNFYAVDNGLRFKIEPSSGPDEYRIASYTGDQIAEQTFTFTYVVGSTDGATDKGEVYLDDMTLLGDTYDTALNLESNLTYDATTGDSGHDVDSGAPIVSALSIDGVSAGTVYTLGIGTTLRFSLTFDEAISFDTSASDLPYLELKAVDTNSSIPQRIRADFDPTTSSSSNGFFDSINFTFVVGQGNAGTSADNNATQQSLYNFLEVFAIQNADQIQDKAGNVLASSGDYALSADPFETIHPDGVDPEPDTLGDTMIYIDAVRPQITLLELDKSSAETYGNGEDIALTISFSEPLNEKELNSGSTLSQVVMHLQRTEPDFTDPSRDSFAYTFSKRSTNDSVTAVEYVLSATGSFINFVYEGSITGEYNLSGNIRDLGGNAIDPADLNIYTNGSVSNPTSLSAVSPTAFVDHLAPRPLATTVRLSGGGVPEINSTSSPYKLGDVFVFTITFHEELSLRNHDDDLSNLRLDFAFDDGNSRSIPLGGIPSGDPTKLYFTYTVSDGDQALADPLALDGLSKASGYSTLSLVDSYGNSVDPSSIDFSYYDLDGNGSVDDTNNDGVVDPSAGDEEFTILQPDYNLSIDGIRPYWVSISSSDPTSLNDPYVLGEDQNITFTLTASEELSSDESGMQLLLDLQPENAALGVAETRAILGDFNESHIITFVYTVGVSDPADSLGDGIDHLAIMASSSYQYGTIVTQDLAGNQVLVNDFSSISGFVVDPEDEYRSGNQVKFDTTPPIVESVSINGFDANNLARVNTPISITLQFQDDDLNTSSLNVNRSDINLTLLDLDTDYNRTSETNATLPLDIINDGSLIFAGTLEQNISWSGTFSLQIIDGNSTIVDKAEPANAMTSELIVGSGSDDLIKTYTIDTAPPRIANLNEIDSTINTPVTVASSGYGPGRSATFMVTFNEELFSIGGSNGGPAKLDFFIYDDTANAGTGAVALRSRTATASLSSELGYIEDADGNKRSIAYFYYPVSDQDSGPVYLNYSGISADPTSAANGGNDDYFKCFDGAQSGSANAEPTDCYLALDAKLQDINTNISTFTVSDDWVYAFNRTGDSTLEPLELTRFVTDPLEYIGYKIRVTPTGADRAWGFDVNSTDKNASASSGTPVIALNPDKPYIGASETEDSAGNPGNIYFVIEPGPEEFRLDTTAPVDINLTFSINNAQNAEYVATYLDSNNEYITFEFDIAEFKTNYDGNITLHSISQNASMEYANSANGVYVLADSLINPSADLNASSTAGDDQFDTGLLLDMQKPILESVIAYREPTAGDGNFSVPIAGEPYFGRGAQVVLRFEFSEPLGSVQTTGSNSKITLPLELDTGAIVIEQSTPASDDRSDPSDDFLTFDVTYTVGDTHAGSINNDYFVLDAIVSDQNGNTITGSDLNYSLLANAFDSPLVNGDFPEFADVNIYRNINLNSSSSEVYAPIPDLDNNISEYTLIDGDDLYIAATFTYTLGAIADEYPDFQEYDHDNNATTDDVIDANYSFSSGVFGSTALDAEYLASFSDSNQSSDGANVLLFSYRIDSNESDTGGNYIRLEDLSGLNDASKISDIYGNPTSSYIPDFAADTVTSIDATPPRLIGASHVVAEGQDNDKINYGPLDSNITFALTFNEVIDTTESFKTLQLSFYIEDSGTYSPRVITANSHVLEEAVPDPASGYELGQVVNMIYLIASTDGGTIDVAASSYPMRVTGDIYDHHNGSKGNSDSISSDINNSSDLNSNFYIPKLEIDQTAITASRWSIEAISTSGSQVFSPYGSPLVDGVVWESNSSNLANARVGIGNTLSFIIDYPTEISSDALYFDDDITGSSADSVLSKDNNVSLLFTDNSGLTFAASIDEVYSNPDPSINSSSLIFTYQIEEALALELEDLAFHSVGIPPDTIIRSTAFNEIIISGSDFEQDTTAMIDAIYPEIEGIEVTAPNNSTFYDSATNRRYFGEDDIITFRITFSEALIDDNTSDNDPDFDLRWTILDDDDNTSLRYFDSSSTSIATSDVEHDASKRVYELQFPVELESNSALGYYQGLIQFSATAATEIFTNGLGIIQDQAQNSLESFVYSVATDLNASADNHAVDFIRPRLQYIDSAGSGLSIADRSYTHYESIGGSALTHYYGELDLDFYIVHDSALDINTGSRPDLALSVPATNGDVDFNLSPGASNLTRWPATTTYDNALSFQLDIATAQSSLAASGETFAGAVTFSKILNATNYFDQPGNYAYFQLIDSGPIQYVYSDDNLNLNYSPSVAAIDSHAYPMPTIYIDTTPPSFTIDNTETIELTNRALVFELNLDRPLSALELDSTFNTDSNSSYHSAPTYELSWRSGSTNYSYSDLLYDGIGGGADIGNNQVEPFIFTLFSDAGTITSAGSLDPNANYATYLDGLAESDYNFTMAVTDFVGNVATVTFEVTKETDEFLGHLTGWEDSNSSAYDTDTDDGQIVLDDKAISATFLVSFVTEIDESTLDATDFEFAYSTSGADDIANLSIASIVDNSSTTDANDYLITVSGGNLPLAAGTFTLAFADTQDIQIADGDTIFDPNLIGTDNKSFSYSKQFSFTIDAIAQPNHGSSGVAPDLEIDFTAPDTGGSSSIAIEGYKLYYTLDHSEDPTTASPYFSSREHSGFSSTNSAQQFSNACLPILDGSSQEYSFRVVAEYSIDNNSATVYETDISRGSVASIELNASAPSYTAGASLNLPFCTRATLLAADVDVAANFGRGLALSRDSVDSPLRNLLASGQYQISSGVNGGAIRHYSRSGAEFISGLSNSTDLELAVSNAQEFGHNLAFPSAAFTGYDLFISGDPFLTDNSNVNTGYIQLYHKGSSADNWNSQTINPGSVNAASGASVAIAVNGTKAFALYGQPRHASDSGQIVVMEFTPTGSSSWTQKTTATSSIAGDSLFGSAIAVSEAGDIVAVMSTDAVHIFSLGTSGSLNLLHTIEAKTFLGASTSFVATSANQGQSLAIQQTELDATYLLAIGLPHDSYAGGGVVSGADSHNFTTTGSHNYGGVLLLTTTTDGRSVLSASSSWRQLAYLRATTPTVDGFYGSNLLFANPAQPVLFVSEPKLGYSYDSTSFTTSITTSSATATAKLHTYYLNTDGTNAQAATDLIFSPNTTFTSNTAGYAYDFAYANNTLALSSPVAGNDGAGQVFLFNLFPALDLSNLGGSAPKALSSHAIDPSNSATTLSFGIRFPATVDATTIDASDFTPVITSVGGTDLQLSDLSSISVSGALDYWEVTLQVNQTGVESGEVHLAFASGAAINSSTGLAFDLSEFNTSNITSSANASSYLLDYDSPALASIERLNPSVFSTNAEAVTFQLSFTNELNISNLNTSARDDLLDDYFSVTAESSLGSATFDVVDLSTSGDNGIDVLITSSSGTNTTMQVKIANIKSIIYPYTDTASNASIFSASNVANFDLTLVIATGIASVLGDIAGNPLDAASIANPTDSTKDDYYTIDYIAPEIDSLSSSLPDGSYIGADASITYTIAFSENVQPPQAQDFELNIAEAANSSYSGSNIGNGDKLHNIFGGNADALSFTMTSGSGYAISPTANSDTFTLTITINEGDFPDLISEEFHLSVLTSVSDVYGNPLPAQYSDSNNYSINFNQFVLEGYGPTIATTTTGTLADGNLTSHLNIFSFLDDLSSGSSTPSFGFSFSFANEINTSTVDLGDFDMHLGGINLATNPTIKLTFSAAADGAGGYTELEENYTLGTPAISFSGDKKTILLEYSLTENMLEYGFDLPDDLSIAIKDTNSIESATGSTLLGGSQPTAYSINAQMPLLVAFENFDASGNAASADDGFISAYHTFNHDLVSSSDTYYGFQLRYSFSEAIYSARGKADTTPYASPNYSHYLTYSDASLLTYATHNLLPSGYTSTIPNNTGSNYYRFVEDGALVKSSSSSSSHSASWDHLVYLTEDDDDFIEQNSEHNYTLNYDDDYLTYPSGNLPIFLGGYGGNSNSYSSSTNQAGTFLLDEHGNPARIDPSWLPLGGAESNATLALTFDTKTPVLTDVTALNVEDSNNDGKFDDYNGSFGVESDVATFAFELTFDKAVDATGLNSGLVWSITGDGTTPELGDRNVTGPVYNSTTGGFIYTASAEVSGLYDSSGTYEIRFDDTATIIDAAGNQVDTSYNNGSANSPSSTTLPPAQPLNALMSKPQCSSAASASTLPLSSSSKTTPPTSPNST